MGQSMDVLSDNTEDFGKKAEVTSLREEDRGCVQGGTKTKS